MAILQPLEDEVDGLKVRTLLEGSETPFVLARMVPGAFTNDSLNRTPIATQNLRAMVDVHAYTYGPEAETQGWAISEMCRQALMAAWLGNVVYPGIGHIAKMRVSSPARRAPDWQTGTGVQQYGNLPKGTLRYQATYGLVHRPDRNQRMSATDLKALANL